MGPAGHSWTPRQRVRTAAVRHPRPAKAPGPGGANAWPWAELGASGGLWGDLAQAVWGCLAREARRDVPVGRGAHSEACRPGLVPPRPLLAATPPMTSALWRPFCQRFLPASRCFSDLGGHFVGAGGAGWLGLESGIPWGGGGGCWASSAASAGLRALVPGGRRPCQAGVGTRLLPPGAQCPPPLARHKPDSGWHQGCEKQG